MKTKFVLIDYRSLTEKEARVFELAIDLAKASQDGKVDVDAIIEAYHATHKRTQNARHSMLCCIRDLIAKIDQRSDYLLKRVSELGAGNKCVYEWVKQQRVELDKLSRVEI